MRIMQTFSCDFSPSLDVSLQILETRSTRSSPTSILTIFYCLSSSSTSSASASNRNKICSIHQPLFSTYFIVDEDELISSWRFSRPSRTPMGRHFHRSKTSWVKYTYVLTKKTARRRRITNCRTRPLEHRLTWRHNYVLPTLDMKGRWLSSLQKSRMQPLQQRRKPKDISKDKTTFEGIRTTDEGKKKVIIIPLEITDSNLPYTYFMVVFLIHHNLQFCQIKTNLPDLLHIIQTSYNKREARGLKAANQTNKVIASNVLITQH